MTFQWSSLPPELKLLIFDFLCNETGFIRYATVCKEWQAFFERKLYRHLTLTPSLLSGFGTVPRRKRLLVEHVEFLIELTNRPIQIADNENAGRAIARLFRVLNNLNKWNDPRDPTSWLPRGGRITLEIGISSPRHWRRGGIMETTGEEDEDHHNAPDRIGRLNAFLAPKASIWVDQAMREYEPRFVENYRPVKVVKTLLLRRNFQRHIQIRYLARILKSFPNLQNFHIEPWQKVWASNQDLDKYGFGRDYTDFLLKGLPQAVKTVTIFQDFSEVYRSMARWGKYIPPFGPRHYGELRFEGRRRKASKPPEKPRATVIIISEALALKSRDLEHLAVSYMADANDFFDGCSPDWHWEHLKTLSLTSELLDSRTEHAPTAPMLVSAGKTATRMPKLEVMELWYGARHTACVFRYRVADGNATLGWTGTYDLDLDLDSEIVAVWSEVAKMHTGQALQVLPNKRLEAREIESHGVAISRLNLNERVIHPLSVKEIQRETEKDFANYFSLREHWVRLGQMKRGILGPGEPREVFEDS